MASEPELLHFAHLIHLSVFFNVAYAELQVFRYFEGAFNQLSAVRVRLINRENNSSATKIDTSGILDPQQLDPLYKVAHLTDNVANLRVSAWHLLNPDKWSDKKPAVWKWFWVPRWIRDRRFRSGNIPRFLYKYFSSEVDRHVSWVVVVISVLMLIFCTVDATFHITSTSQLKAEIGLGWWLCFTFLCLSTALPLFNIWLGRATRDRLTAVVDDIDECVTVAANKSTDKSIAKMSQALSPKKTRN